MTTQIDLGGTFTLPGTSMTVNRMGYGAMQLAGPQVWGPPRDEAEAMAEEAESSAQSGGSSEFSKYRATRGNVWAAVWTSAAEGLRFALGNPFLRAITITAALSNLGAKVVAAVYILYASWGSRRSGWVSSPPPSASARS